VLDAPDVLREVVQLIGVNQAYVCLARAHCNQFGQTSSSAQCNHMLVRLAAFEGALRKLCQWARDVHGMEVGTTTMHKSLGRLWVTLKKITQHAAE